MTNDSLRHEFGQVLALVQEQMRDLSSVQQQSAKMQAKATAADGTVEVTVNAQRMIVKTVVHESFLEDHEFAELGAHITSAAQAAVRQLDQRSQALLEPMNERRKQVSEISENVIGVPGFREAMAEMRKMTDMTRPDTKADDGGGDRDGGEDSSFPTIRS